MPVSSRSYCLSDFDFDLPPELIAQQPNPQRSASRLLDATQPQAVDRIFADLSGLLKPQDLLVLNNTRVIKARLYGQKSSGGRLQALVERILPNQEVWAHIRASKSPQAGAQLWFSLEALESATNADGFNAQVLGRAGPENSLFHLRLDGDPLALLDRFGHVPLPPYITHSDSSEDLERYQSVFAERAGAVAAPTASLHFDQALLKKIALEGVDFAYVTLHVGAGTFQPVRSENLSEHRMHSEWFEVPPNTVAAIHAARLAGGRIIAVGTTTLRALESAARDGELAAGSRDTDIFITPGFDFRVVDRLITNFHLPKSTLLMLVSAFAGYEKIRDLYAHAIAQRYRFFSYGDAMLLDKATH